MINAHGTVELTPVKDDLCKSLLGGQRMTRVQNGVKHCRKSQPTEYGARTLQTTDGRNCDGKYPNVRINVNRNKIRKVLLTYL